MSGSWYECFMTDAHQLLNTWQVFPQVVPDQQKQIITCHTGDVRVIAIPPIMKNGYSKVPTASACSTETQAITTYMYRVWHGEQLRKPKSAGHMACYIRSSNRVACRLWWSACRDDIYRSSCSAISGRSLLNLRDSNSTFLDVLKKKIGENFFDLRRRQV